MSEMRRKDNDRLIIGYENEYEKLAFDEVSTEDENILSGMRELANEFREVFGISDRDEMPLSQRIKKILDSITVDGESYNFLRPGGWLDDEAAMACAMARIKKMAVYGQNPKSNDGVYHIVYLDPESDSYKALGNGLDDIATPPKPEPPRRKFLFTDEKDADRYNREMSSYYETIREQKRLDAIRKNNEKYVEKAEKEAESVKKTDEHMGVRNISIHDLMADKNGNKGTLKQRLEDVRSYTRSNSKEYNEFLKSLDSVNKLWEMPDTKENTKAMLQAYERLEKACTVYLDKNSSPRHTDMGEKRIEIVRDVLNLQRREKKELEGYYNTFVASPRERILGDCVEKARYIKLDEKEHTLSRIGAGTSVRLHIKGKDVNGIFTEEKAEKFPGYEGIILRNLQNVKNLPRSIAGKICDCTNCATIGYSLTKIQKEEDVYKFLVDRNILINANNEAGNEEKQQWKAFAENLSAKFKELNNNKIFNSFTAVRALEEIIKDHAPAQYKDVLNKYNDSYKIYNIISSRDVSVDRKLEYLYKREVCDIPDIKKGSAVRKELERFLKDISLETFSQRVAESAGIELERRTELNTRNIATSVLAELIGCPGAVAKTEKATVVTKDGKTGEGIFMEYVQGVEGARLTYDEDEKTIMDQRANGRLKKKIADLQILDSLCGQTDRHPNNIMFQTDENGFITDIKGIDNDMSFGISKLNYAGCYSVNLGVITHVDETTANNIRNLNKEILEYKMKDLLVQTEIDSLWDRVRVMQAWLDEPGVKIVPTDQWKNKDWGELAKGIKREVNVVSNGQQKKYEQTDFNNSNLFYVLGEKMLPRKKLNMCLAQNDEEKTAYRENIRSAMRFEKDKLSNIRAMDNEGRTRQNTAAQPSREQGMGMNH